MDAVSLVLSSFLMAGLCLNIIIVNLSRYRIRRFYGIFTVTYYVIFLTVALLTETGVLLSNWEVPREVDQ